MSALADVGALSLAAWLYLALFHGRFWQCDQRLGGRAPAPPRWPAVVAVVPARDEAALVFRHDRLAAGPGAPGRAPRRAFVYFDSARRPRSARGARRKGRAGAGAH